MTDRLSLDIDGLTFAEMELIEDRCGKPVAEVFGGNLSATAMRCCAFIAMRRSDPEASWEDTADLSLNDFEMGDSGDVPPTDANG